MSRLLGILVVLAPVAAGAQLYGDTPLESPRGHQLEIKLGPFTPRLAEEKSDAGDEITAYDKIFGGALTMMHLRYDYLAWNGFGSLGVGLGVGYGSVSGKGLIHDDSASVASRTASDDKTRFQMLPTALTATYALDALPLRWNVPVVPYVRFGFDLVFWWVTDGVGNLARSSYCPAQGTCSNGTRTGAGNTFGWHVAGGIKLLLDGIAPGMARSFDTETGVNNTYVVAEILYSDISDFGSATSWDVGTFTGMFGMAFEF